VYPVKESAEYACVVKRLLTLTVQAASAANVPGHIAKVQLSHTLTRNQTSNVSHDMGQHCRYT
jgi:hypothetical protein